MRAPQGTISRLRNGRFWARAPLDDNGKQKSLGVYATYNEAQVELHSFLVAVAKKDEIAELHITFAKFGAAVLNQREEENVKGIRTERNRFKNHLAASRIANMALTAITSGDVAELGRDLMRKLAADKREKRKVKRNTVQRILSLGSVIMTEAIQRGIIHTNPFTGVEVRKRKDEDTEDVWTFLNPEEQKALLTCEEIPYAARLAIAFAMYTGVREGELCHAYLKDLHINGAKPELIVRYGSKDANTKAGKVRHVPLIPGGLQAAKAWLLLRPTFIRKVKGARHEVRPDEGIILPTVTGCRRQSGKPLGNGWKDKKTGAWVDRFKHYCTLAGVTLRPGLHWHCLRHTCATSLLEGWWGPPWSLEEVKEMLGHSTIAVTQRYAHHAGTRLRAAADRMPPISDALVTGGGFPVLPTAAISSDINVAGAEGLEPTTCGFGIPGSPEENQQVIADRPPEIGVSVTNLEARALELMKAGRVDEALALLRGKP